MKPNTLCVPHLKFKKIGGYKLQKLDPGNYSVQIRAISLAFTTNYTEPRYFVVPAPSTRKWQTEDVLERKYCCFKFWGFSLLIAKKLYISKLIVFIKKQTHMNKNTSKSEHEKHISLQTTERHSTFQQLCVLLFKNKQVFLCQRWRWTFVYYNTCKRDISFEIFFIHVYPRVRCLLTINGGNVINASCLTAQYFNY